MFRCLLVCFLTLIPANLRAQAPTPAPEAPLRTAGDRPIDIQNIRLDLKVDLPKKSVDAVATIDFVPLRPLASVDLDAVEFEVKSVSLIVGKEDKKSLRFRHDGEKLTIDLPADAVAEGKSAQFVIAYRVRDPKAGLHFFGPTPNEPNVPLTVWSQGEAITNRYWIPCLDHPGEKQTSELVVTAPKGFEVLSNGKLIERLENPDDTVTFHWKQTKPHVSYLITLVVGKFDVVTEEWKGIPVTYYVPPGRKQDVARTFGRTREMLDFFSMRFGIQYPWEKYAQVCVEQFTSGGMENTSATTLVESAIIDERSALDRDSDRLIAHELGHQWWGDLVTCRDWAHLWLNEGFATFCEIIWAEHHQGADEAQYALLGKARGAITGGRTRPIVDRRYAGPRLMFDSRAYPKGGWVLQMLRAKVGEKVFWKAIRRWGTEYAHKSAETADFRRTMEQVTGMSLERFFYDWTERPGNPDLGVKIEYDAKDKFVKLTVNQKQAGEAFHFTLPIHIHVEGVSQPIVFNPEVTDKDRTLYVPVPDRPTMVLIDPELTVLAEFKIEKGRDLWKEQLLNGPTVASRVRAAEHFGNSKTPADRELLAKALKEEKFWGVASDIANALGKSGGDVCRDALIAGIMHKDPKVRRACVIQLGKYVRDEKVAKALKDLLQKGDPSVAVESSAIRSFAQLQQPDTVAVLLPWLAKESPNETLRSAALFALGSAQDLSALDTLIAWTKKGKPLESRTAALGALGNLASTANPSEAERKQIVDAIAACLDGEGSRVRRAAVSAIRDLGKEASPNLTVLQAIADHDPDDRIADLAKRSVEAIRNNAPAPVEVKRLRDELDRLRKANEELQERLDKFIQTEKK